jgi:hypothetical protein
VNRYLVSVTNPSYVPKTGRYFNSLALVRSARPVVVLLDFTPETDPEQQVERALRESVHWAEYRHLPLPATHSNYMIQHCFMDALPDVPDDDLIVLTDLDLEVQRDLTESEWKWVEALGPDRLAATWNGGSGDNLFYEADRITLAEEWVRALDCDVTAIGCMNCGVLAGRAGAFRTLQTHYERLCDGFYAASSHRSRCQWLINYVVHRQMNGFVLLPEQITLHGHFRNEKGQLLLPIGTELRGRVVTMNGDPVVFLHNFPDWRTA